MNFVIEQLKELDTIKEKQSKIVERNSSLLTKTEDKVNTWASLCNIVVVAPLSSVEKLVQGKMEDERVKRTRELNLRVHGLPSNANPLAVEHSFLTDQLGISDITLDRCRLGKDGILFIRFLSLSNRLRALREKRNLFPLSPKIFLDEDLAKS